MGLVDADAGGFTVADVQAATMISKGIKDTVLGSTVISVASFAGAKAPAHLAS
jgi:hypothetical protein